MTEESRPLVEKYEFISFVLKNHNLRYGRMKDEDLKNASHEMVVMHHSSVEFDGSSDEEEELAKIPISKSSKTTNKGIYIILPMFRRQRKFV
jgi:hypothetical protein